MNYIKFALLLCFVSFFAHAQIPEAEQKALKDLYRFTNGEQWQNTWDESQSWNSFYGVSIVNNHVIKLDLSKNKLEGELPSSLNDLIYLEHLDLSNNALSGELPALDRLTHLKVLVLTDNELSGIIPEGFKALKHLKRLELADNFFSNSQEFEHLELAIAKRSLMSNSK